MAIEYVSQHGSSGKHEKKITSSQGTFPHTFWQETFPKLVGLAKDPENVADLPRNFGTRSNVAEFLGINALRDLATQMEKKGATEESMPDGDWERQILFERSDVSDVLVIRVGKKEKLNKEATTQVVYQRDGFTGDESVDAFNRTGGIHQELDLKLFPSGILNTPGGYTIDIMQKERFGFPSIVSLRGKELKEGVVDFVEVAVSTATKNTDTFFLADHEERKD